MIICERGHDEKRKKWGKLSEKRKKEGNKPTDKDMAENKKIFQRG